MQGVQPAPKAAPTPIVPKYPAGLSFTCTRRSLNNGAILKTPVRCRPSTMMTAPPTRAIQTL